MLQAVLPLDDPRRRAAAAALLRARQREHAGAGGPDHEPVEPPYELLGAGVPMRYVLIRWERSAAAMLLIGMHHMLRCCACDHLHPASMVSCA